MITLAASCDVLYVVCVCIWQVLKSGELLGYFVKADVWCKMLLQNVKSSQSAGSLSILAAVIRGSEASQLCPHLDDISAVITDPAICHIAEVLQYSFFINLYYVYFVFFCILPICQQYSISFT